MFRSFPNRMKLWYEVFWSCSNIKQFRRQLFLNPTLATNTKPSPISKSWDSHAEPRKGNRALWTHNMQLGMSLDKSLTLLAWFAAAGGGGGTTRGALEAPASLSTLAPMRAEWGRFAACSLAQETRKKQQRHLQKKQIVYKIRCMSNKWSSWNWAYTQRFAKDTINCKRKIHCTECRCT